MKKLAPNYAKHLVVCAQITAIWDSGWEEDRHKREQTSAILSDYIETEMIKHRKLWALAFKR